MGLWESPFGSIALDLAASVLWDGGKLFAGKAHNLASDRLALNHLAREVERRTGVLIRKDALGTWLEDETFWSLLAVATSDRRVPGEAALAFRVNYLPNVDEDGSSKVLSVLLVETARTDVKLMARLRDARLDNTLQVLEVGLGYVIDELLNASSFIQSSINDGFGEVSERLSEVLDRLPDPAPVGSLEEELQRIVAMVEEGTLLREAAIQLQITIYREGRSK